MFRYYYFHISFKYTHLHAPFYLASFICPRPVAFLLGDGREAAADVLRRDQLVKEGAPRVCGTARGLPMGFQGHQ